MYYINLSHYEIQQLSSHYLKVFKQRNKKVISQQQKEKNEKKRKEVKEQIKRFRSECMGPIFTCICCMRDLFKRSVVELKGALQAKILNENNMQQYLNFDESLKIKDEIEYISKKGDNNITKTKKIQEGYYLCVTCISYLKKSKMPPMCAKNLLEPAKVPDCLKDWTDLEKQLIVKKLLFIKIRQLPKTRMAAMNDRVINVAIADDNIAKRVDSLPRTEDNSGLVNVGLKRKLNMKNYHKQGLIKPHRVYQACEYLVKNHPAYMNIKLKKYDEWVKNCPTLFDQTDKSDEEKESEGSSGDEAKETTSKSTVQGEVEANDFNAKTCLYPKEPESDMVVNHTNKAKKIKFKRKAKKIYDYAPGEKQLATNWIREKDHDEVAFHELYSDGKGGINAKRPVKITKGDFCSCKFLNHNKMYSKTVITCLFVNNIWRDTS